MTVPRRGRLASRRVFFARVRRSMAIAAALLGGTLLVGTIGYMVLYEVDWVDAFHQAAMLMAGMGPVLAEKDKALSDVAKLFDAFYALFCGVLLLVATGVLLAPLVHRALHRFHLEDAGDER